jgi:flagellar hook assembly protein FlgD
VTTLARVVFLALVAATFGAFFVAQRLKGSPPVVQLHGQRWLSPNGDGHKDTAALALRVREADVLTADLVDAAGNPVRRLVTERPIRPSAPVRFTWDGRTDDGTLAPDGVYRVRGSLLEQGRSVVNPRLITLDTKPPHPRVVEIRPGQVVGPVPPLMSVLVSGVSPRSATRFRVIRTDAGAPQLVAKGSRAPGLRRWQWDGRSGGKPVPSGVYVVQVRVRDRAGNIGSNPEQVPFDLGDSPGPAGITVRSLAAQPPLRPVTAGERADFFVDSRARPYRWAIRRVGATRPVRRGKVAAGAKGPLELRAPRGTSGLYMVELQAGRDRTEVPFIVQARERATMLVVVPAITWLGTDPVDDPPLRDGMPDTLDREGGGRVRWPRVFASEDGRPAGLSSQVAPLLRFLDRNSIRYDLTSDLDLALSDAPRASDRKAVLLAGSERWVTRSLARRLRRYVQDGGHLATFGPETLRRGVSLRANDAETGGELLRPTQPSPEDPFGARLGPVRRSDAPQPIAQLGGDPGYGLFTGTSGTIDGFSAFEESAPPEEGGKATVLGAMGVAPPEPDPNAPADEPPPEARYALTATRLGEDGLVIRVGLPQWARRLREPQVAQVTRNIIDLLRGQEPKIRSLR